MAHPYKEKIDGRALAHKRYGARDEKIPAPSPSEQAPQFPDSKHGEKYDNNASGWVRGMPNENATGKPFFDKGKR